jgi:hypothetical protein
VNKKIQGNKGENIFRGEEELWESKKKKNMGGGKDS